MTLNDQLGAPVAGPRIWASDIDTEVLAKAEAGIYRLSDLDALTLAQKRHYFLRGAGDNSEWVKARQELLSAIHYQQLNLLDEKWSVPGPFDAISLPQRDDLFRCADAAAPVAALCASARRAACCLSAIRNI